MSEKIASLYAEIGADTTKLKRGLQETKDGLTGAKSAMSDFLGVITKGAALAGAEFMVLKQAFEFGKAGAQLEYAEVKFDRLAQSIGTTSDVLMHDLKKATGGLMSDAEIMASAGDLMALGLAKTHDEAVRLTTVAGQLGMNMNQLVLTLTNQTTMRFDALGISVDGFEERLASLKATGMDTNEAFKEAFLQQAEEQLATVGSIIDQDVAAFMRLEASAKNLGDHIKMAFAPVLADAATAADLLFFSQDRLVQAWIEHEQDIRNNTQTYEEYTLEMERAAQAAGYNINAQGQLVELYQTASGRPIEKIIEGTGVLAETEWNLAAAAEEAAEFQQRFAGSSQASAEATANVRDNMITASQAMTEYSDRMLFNAAAANLNEEDQLMLAEKMGLVDETTMAALEALGLMTEEYRTGAVDAASYTDSVAALADAINSLQSKTVTVTLRTIHQEIYDNTGRGNTAADQHHWGAASGADFIVPPGYQNDSFPIYAQSGERVQITPANQLGSGRSGGTTLVNYGTIVFGEDQSDFSSALMEAIA